MTNTGTTTTPAGWYPDPAGSPRTRWWDGSQWTDTFADAQSTPAPYTYAPAGPLRAPEGTSPFTPWVWLLAVVPLINLAYVIYAGTSGELASIYSTLQADSLTQEASTAFVSSSLFSGVLGWIIIGANILLAGLDWHSLKTQGMPKPFHWTWGLFSILGVPVYIIGRTIVAKRRTGAGLAPLFVYLGCGILSFIASLIVALVTLGPMLATLSQ